MHQRDTAHLSDKLGNIGMSWYLYAAAIQGQVPVDSADCTQMLAPKPVATATDTGQRASAGRQSAAGPQGVALSVRRSSQVKSC